MTAYIFERAPTEASQRSHGTMLASCWCDSRAIELPVELIGERTYSCGSRQCERMNAAYEGRK